MEGETIRKSGDELGELFEVPSGRLDDEIVCELVTGDTICFILCYTNSRISRNHT